MRSTLRYPILPKYSTDKNPLKKKKSWYPVFSSNTLAQAALRIHYPLCYEIRAPSRPIDSSVFNRVGRRYAALKSGVPQQELRIPITKTRRNECVWTFSENLIVAQVRHHPVIQLALVYLDTSGGTRRIRNGKVTVPAKGETSVAVKVCFTPSSQSKSKAICHLTDSLRGLPRCPGS